MEQNKIKKLKKKIIPNKISNLIRKNRLRNIQKKIELNSISNNIIYSNKTNILSELCEKYGSDKGFVNFNLKKPYFWRPHSYTSHYHSIFSLSKESIKLVFECGLGTNNTKLKSNMSEHGSPGASLRVWRDYFTNAKIFGADIDKSILFNEERIKTYYVDQLDTNSINNMWNKIKEDNFDIIIDDGLHEPEANLNLFHNSFIKLKKYGLYIIEDVPNKYLTFIQNELKNFEIEIVILRNKYKEYYGNNNLIIIKKNT